MGKSLIRSMRFSEDIYNMIESQIGNNFTEKFNSLVTRCMYELPEKEKQIKALDKEIKKKQEELQKLSDKYYGLHRLFASVSNSCEQIAKSLYSQSEKM